MSNMSLYMGKLNLFLCFTYVIRQRRALDLSVVTNFAKLHLEKYHLFDTLFDIC